MALLADVKSELAAFEGDSPAAIKAQAAAMIRFGGGLRPVQNTYVIQAVFTSLDVAEWLKNTLRNAFGHEAEVNHLTRQTPNGPVETYVVLVTRNVVALALQTGLVDRRKQQVRGLPSEVVNGSIAQIKAAWRGAFMARGFLSDPGKASFLEIACPTEEAAMALCGVARRLGIQAKHRTLRSSEPRDTQGSRRHRTHAQAHGRHPFGSRMDRQAFRWRGPRQGQPSGQLR